MVWMMVVWSKSCQYVKSSDFPKSKCLEKPQWQIDKGGPPSSWEESDAPLSTVTSVPLLQMVCLWRKGGGPWWHCPMSLSCPKDLGFMDIKHPFTLYIICVPSFIEYIFTLHLMWTFLLSSVDSLITTVFTSLFSYVALSFGK